MEPVATTQALDTPTVLKVFSTIDSHFVAVFGIFVAIVLMTSVLVSRLLWRSLGIPPITGQIIAGFILGPSLLNIASLPLFAFPLQWNDSVTKHMFSIQAADLFGFILYLVSTALTLSYISWLAGRETPIHDMKRFVLSAGSAGIAGSLMTLVSVTAMLVYGFGATWSVQEAIAAGIVLAPASVSIPAALLFAYNRLRDRSSKVALGSAVIDDLLVLVVASFFLVVVQAGVFGQEFAWASGGAKALMRLGSIFGVLVCVSVIGYYIIPRCADLLVRIGLGDLVPVLLYSFIVLAFSVSEWVSAMAGIAAAYCAGLFHRTTDKTHGPERILSPFVSTILLPLSFGSIGLQIDIGALGIRHYMIVFWLVVCSILAKQLGAWLASLSFQLWAEPEDHFLGVETYLLGTLMSIRGEVSIAAAITLYNMRLLTIHHYAICMLVVVLTSIIAPILFSFGVRYERVMHGKRGRKLFERVCDQQELEVVGVERFFAIAVDILGEQSACGLQRSDIGDSQVAECADQELKVVLKSGKKVSFVGDRQAVDELLGRIKQAITAELEQVMPAS